MITRYVVSGRGLGHIVREGEMPVRYTLCGQSIRKEWTYYNAPFLRFYYLCRRCNAKSRL